MGRLLRRLAAGFLRTRAGLALLLAVLVLGVVGAARVLIPAGPDTASPGPVEPLAVSPTVPDDGLLSPGATPSPTRLPDSAAPAAVARLFAVNWLAHTGVSAEEWHAQLIPYSTDDLAQQLEGVAPEVVPAERITGEPAALPQAATVVEVVIPVDTGELRLRVLAVDGRWLVDGVDWGRA